MQCQNGLLEETASILWKSLLFPKDRRKNDHCVWDVTVLVQTPLPNAKWYRPATSFKKAQCVRHGHWIAWLLEKYPRSSCSYQHEKRNVWQPHHLTNPNHFHSHKAQDKKGKVCVLVCDTSRNLLPLPSSANDAPFTSVSCQMSLSHVLLPSGTAQGSL